MGILSRSATSIIGVRGGGLSFLAALCLVGGVSLSGVPANAAHNGDHSGTKQAAEKMTALASKDPETTSSIVEDQNDGLNCDRARKRLWVEGEGWIVRRVTTCY